MAGRAAVTGDKTEHLVEIQQRGVGGSEVGSDEDEGFVGGRNPRCGHAAQVRDDPLGDVAEIRGALRHQAAHADEDLLEGCESLENRSLATLAGVDPRIDVVDECRILSHERRRLEHIPGSAPCLLPTRLVVGSHGRECFADPCLLGTRITAVTRILGFRQRIGHPNDLPDGNSPTNTDAMQIHGFPLPRVRCLW